MITVFTELATAKCQHVLVNAGGWFLMRTFTDIEKQQLQAKIKDEQERQQVLRKIAQVENEKESKRGKGFLSTALSVKYGFLGLILCLLVFNVIVLLLFGWRNTPPTYFGFMIALGLLFNHIAYHFTKKGWLSRVMKTIAWTWIVFVFAYLFWLGLG